MYVEYMRCKSTAVVLDKMYGVQSESCRTVLTWSRGLGAGFVDLSIGYLCHFRQ